jgi:hypothetical protein
VRFRALHLHPEIILPSLDDREKRHKSYKSIVDSRMHLSPWEACHRGPDPIPYMEERSHHDRCDASITPLIQAEKEKFGESAVTFSHLRFALEFCRPRKLEDPSEQLVHIVCRTRLSTGRPLKWAGIMDKVLSCGERKNHSISTTLDPSAFVQKVWMAMV